MSTSSAQIFLVPEVHDLSFASMLYNVGLGPDGAVSGPGAEKGAPVPSCLASADPEDESHLLHPQPV